MNKIHFLIPVVSMLFAFAVTQPVYGDVSNISTEPLKENQELQFGESNLDNKNAELQFSDQPDAMKPATAPSDASTTKTDSFQFGDEPAMTHDPAVTPNDTMQFGESDATPRMSTESTAPSDSFQFGDRMNTQTNVPVDNSVDHFEFGERRTTNEMVIPPSGMVRDQMNTSTVVVDEDADEDADSALEDKIEEAVEADKTLADEVSDFDVEVSDGVATLTGEASSDVVKANLVSKVMAVKGVVKVDDQLTVEKAE